MKKEYRYILYVLIGVLIYFMSGANEDRAVLNKIHNMAPILIIGLVILLFIVRYLISRQKKPGDDDD